MPKRLELRVSTPPDVFTATQAFNSELRLHLIRYFAHSPGQQVDAARAIGADRATVSLNVRALLDTGVLIVEGRNQRSLSFRVDQNRLEHLVEELRHFTALD